MLDQPRVGKLRMRSRGASLAGRALVLGLSLFVAAPSSAVDAPVAWDQTVAAQPGVRITTALGDLAWSFSPGSTWLSVIELEIGCCQAASEVAVRLDVRDQNLSGSVVGSSERVLVDGTAIDSDDDALNATRFRFDPALALTPGATYVVEVVRASPGDVSFTAVGGAAYGAGTAFLDGTEQSFDPLFRTGRFAPQPQVYWVDWIAGRIERAAFDGSNREVVHLRDDLEVRSGIAVDPVNDTLYWREGAFATGAIWSSGLDGGEPRLAASTGFGPSRFVADATRQTLFFTDQVHGELARVGYDGTGRTQLVFTSWTSSPLGVALDPLGDALYWTLAGSNGSSIRRVGTDGSGGEVVLPVPPGGATESGDEIRLPEDLAIDPAAGKLYWTDRDRAEIRRANLDGSGIELLVDTSGGGLSRPGGIAIDPAAGLLFWTDTALGTVSRANLDGSDPVTIVTGLTEPFDVALTPLPEPGGVLALLAGVALLRVLARRR